MKKKLLKLLNIFFFLLGCFFIYFIGTELGWMNIWLKLTSIEVWKLIVILLFPLLWQVFHCLGWMFVLGQKEQFKFIHLLGAHMSASAVSEIVPLGQAGGEPYRAYFVKKHNEKDQSPNIIASVVLYNTIHTLVTVLLCVIGLIAILSLINVSFYKLAIFVVGLLIGLAALWFFIQKQKKGLMENVFMFFSRFRLFKKFAERKMERAAQVDEKLIDFYTNHKRNFFISLFFVIIGKVLGAVEFYLIMYFIGHPVDFIVIFAVFAGTAFVSILLFFFPSQVGASEGSIVYLFKALGLNPVYGITLALFKRIRVLFWTFVGLIIGYIWGPKPGSK